MLAVELEGGVFMKGGGGHQRVKVFLDNCDKYNRAALMGYRVLRFTRKHVESWEAARTVKEALDSDAPPAKAGGF
jgi:hypothetical protein